MPELAFTLIWPDGTHMPCRSPSTILRQHLPAGRYDVADFQPRIRTALLAASERVREVHGFPCSQAAAQLRVIETACRRYDDTPDAAVIVQLS